MYIILVCQGKQIGLLFSRVGSRGTSVRKWSIILTEFQDKQGD